MTVLRLYPWLVGAALVTPLGLGNFSWYNDAFSNVRNPFTILLAVSLLLLIFSRSFRGTTARLFTEPDTVLTERGERGLVAFTLAYFLLFYLSVGLTNYMSFGIDAVDFSIWDHAIANTSRGLFMQSFEKNLNHFGVHATPILLLLLPFHRLFDSPLFLVLLYPVALWSAGIPLYLLLKERVGVPWQRVAILFAFYNFVPMARVLNYSFHPEGFYVPLFFWLFLAVEKRRWDGVALNVALLLSVKEDAAVYLCGVALALPFYPSKRRVPAAVPVAMFAASCLVFVINVKWLIPHFAGNAEYRLAGAASGYGRTLGEALPNLLRSWKVIGRDVLTGKWFQLTGEFLFAPLLVPFFLVSVLPYALVHAMAQVEVMKKITYYYCSPYIPMVFTAFLLFLSDGRTKPWARGAFTVYVFLFATFVGGEYLMFSRIQPEWWVMPEVRAEITPEKTVCAPSTLIPHLGYPKVIRSLSADCIAAGLDYYLLDDTIRGHDVSREQINGFRRTLDADPRYVKRRHGKLEIYAKTSFRSAASPSE